MCGSLSRLRGSLPFFFGEVLTGGCGTYLSSDFSNDLLQLSAASLAEHRILIVILETAHGTFK